MQVENVPESSLRARERNPSEKCKGRGKLNAGSWRRLNWNINMEGERIQLREQESYPTRKKSMIQQPAT
ncbi:hypothetical protein Csa_018986, partial [Cucumis sativus]